MFYGTTYSNNLRLTVSHISAQSLKKVHIAPNYPHHNSAQSHPIPLRGAEDGSPQRFFFSVPSPPRRSLWREGGARRRGGKGAPQPASGKPDTRIRSHRFSRRPLPFSLRLCTPCPASQFPAPGNRKKNLYIMSTISSIFYWLAYGAVLVPALFLGIACLLKTTVDLWNDYFDDSDETSVEPSNK